MSLSRTLARRLGLPLLGCLFAAAVTAQIERPIPYPIPEDRDWDKAVAAGTRTAIGRPGANYWTNHASYRIKAELDPATAKVSGHVEMTYENRSPGRLRELKVHLRQNLHKAGGMRNRPVEITGGVTVANVTLGGEPLPENRRRSMFRRSPPGYSIDGTVMTIVLPERLRRGAKVTLGMDWQYQVPKAGAPRNGHEGLHVYYLGYWYPQFAVYEDVQGWVAEQYMSNAEFYMGYADYEVEFTAPQGWLVRITGELTNPADVLTDAARQRLAAAAAGREVVHVVTKEDHDDNKVTLTSASGKLTWRFESTEVRDVAVSVSDRYVWDATHAVVKDRDGVGKDGKAMIHAVYRPEARPWGRAAEFARHTIEHMSTRVSPYLWPHMTVCEGVIGGGMEFPMMTIIGTRGGHGTIAHELIHMWFPMLVGTNEKARAWQDEGITSFYTTLTLANFRERDESVRVGRLDVRNWLGTDARSKVKAPMTHGDLFGDRGGYGQATYSKTAAVMHQLRGMVGDEAFFAAMRSYAQNWAHKHPYPNDLFNTFKVVTGRDLDWYFRTWFYETWRLDQAVASVEQKGVSTEVVIADRGDATYPTVVEVSYSDGQQETRIIDVAHWLSGKRSKTLTFGKDVQKVEIDPSQVTLDVSRRNDVWNAEQK